MHCRFFHRACVNAPVEVAWGVLTEHEKFSEWTDIHWDITTPGEPERDGLGCIRLGQGQDAAPWPIEEVVNYWVPNELYGYHITSGVPVDKHQGIVRFWSKGPCKSEWVYDMQIRPSQELLHQAPDVYQQLLKSLGFFMQDIEAECERRGSLTEIIPPSEIPISIHGGQLS